MFDWVPDSMEKIKLRLFYRSQESTKDRPSIHSATIALLVLVFIPLVSVWTAKDVTKVETD